MENLIELLKGIDVSQIVSVVLLIVTTFAGGKFIKSKNKLKEFKDLVVVLVDALEDNKLSKEEIEQIIKEAKELFNKE